MSQARPETLSCRKERQHGEQGVVARRDRERGTSMPETTVRSARGGGRRSASAAARSTTRPTRPSGTKSSLAARRPRDFDLPGQFGHAAAQQRAVVRFRQANTVVADQARRRKLPGPAGQNELEGEAGLARA